MAMVTVVIPNWNGKQFLGDCLKSLEGQRFTDFKVMVVDNGSTDGSAELAKSNKLPVELIRLERNFGFAAAVNRGIERAESEYVALLNNDTEQHPDWLAALVGALEKDQRYDFATSKMLHFSRRGVVNSAGDGISVYGLTFALGSEEPDGPPFAARRSVFAASGGAGLYRRSLFNSIGMFDERFFAYMEDVDISFRAQLHGHRCLYVPEAIIYHHVGGTSRRLSGFGQFYTTRNTLLMLAKDWPLAWLWRYGFKLVIGQLDWFWRDLHPRRVMSNLRAYGSFFVNLPYALHQRRIIQTGADSREVLKLVSPCHIGPSRLIRALIKLHLVKC